MALEGKIRERDGKLYVEYARTLENEPVRLTMLWRVIESYSNKYNMHRPEAGFHARGEGSGNWSVTSAGNVAAGRVVTEPNASIVEEVPVAQPSAGGKQVRWHEGRWEKLMAKGWIPAGEGKPAAAKAPRASRKAKEPTVDVYRVESEIENASGPTGRWKVTDTFGTLKEAKDTIAWRKSQGGNSRLASSSGKKTPAQLDAEIAAAIAAGDD